MAVLVELSQQMALRRRANMTALDKENVIFFDVLGQFMVRN